MPDDDLSSIRTVPNINALDAVLATNSSQYREHRGQQGGKPPQKKVRDYFHPLSKAVEATNLRLIERKIPYRFNVYKQWGEVYIELFILDENGGIKEKQRKNISHDDFNRIIDNVVSVEGLFFDYQA
jgi:hypothetical protein